MIFKQLHPNWKPPVKATTGSAAFDLFMPVGGTIPANSPSAVFVPLGFAAIVPDNHVALILPRSGHGAKRGLALNNTCGVIDPDYRGEWIAALRVHNHEDFTWEAGDRLLQVLIIPTYSPTITVVDEDQFMDSERGTGGFGSTGN